MHSSQHKFMILCLKQYNLSQILSVKVTCYYLEEALVQEHTAVEQDIQWDSLDWEEEQLGRGR